MNHRHRELVLVIFPIPVFVAFGFAAGALWTSGHAAPLALLTLGACILAWRFLDALNYLWAVLEAPPPTAGFEAVSTTPRMTLLRRRDRADFAAVVTFTGDERDRRDLLALFALTTASTTSAPPPPPPPHDPARRD